MRVNSLPAKQISWRLLFLFASFLSIVIGFNSCSSSDKKRADTLMQDTLVLSNKAYSGLVLDSSLVVAYVNADRSLDSFGRQILDFYERRQFHAAWFVDDKLSTHATTFIERLHHYVTTVGDSSVADAHLLSMADSIAVYSDLSGNYRIQNKLLTDLELTTAFFKYTKNDYYGTDVPIRDLEWYIPRRKKDYLLLLNKLINSDTSYSVYEPANRYYTLLKNALKYYRQLDKSKALPQLSFVKQKLQPSDSLPELVAFKKYLALTDGYAASDSSALFNDSLELCLRKYQQRMGLKASGQPDSATVANMNVPIQSRIQQIMINLERLRWLPDYAPDSYLLVNIPEYRLHVFENKNYQWSMDVVVGKQANYTSVFCDTMRYVVFNPYWNVPPNILVNEVLPALKKNPGYIRKHNMEVLSFDNKVINPYRVSWKKYNTHVPFTIREKPGKDNSLGVLKFLFPNQFNIYMHDTPAKHLFGSDNRAYSHGCIRLADAEKLAHYVFRNDSVVTTEKITELLEAGKEKWVSIKPGIPVYIVYFTAWINHEGVLNFRNDVYGHDEKLWNEVFSK